MADLKQTWNDNAGLRIGTVCVLGGAAAALIAINLLGSNTPTVPRPWAMSLSSGELVDVETPEEITASDDLVEVVVLSAGGCGDVEAGMNEAAVVESGGTFAYLKKPGAGGGMLVASAARPDRWVPMFSNDGKTLQAANRPDAAETPFPDLCTPQ